MRKPFSVPRVAVAKERQVEQGKENACASRAPPKPADPTPVQSTLQVRKVLYAARAAKKRNKKTWLDGVVSIQPSAAAATAAVTLYDMDGKVVATAHRKPVAADSEDLLLVGNWEVELDEAVSAQDFAAGLCFMASTAGVPAADSHNPQKRLKPAALAAPVRAPLKPCGNSRPAGRDATVAPDGALVLEAAASAQHGRVVFVDAFLRRLLRPHQQEGVKFLYKCLAGRAACGSEDSEGGDQPPQQQVSRFTGAILADDMGLGKTLQVLATAWVLMQRGGQGGRGLVRKMLVVAPSSLVKNWGREIQKWLGTARVCYMVLLPGKGAANQVSAFRNGQRWRVLVSSYETIRKFCPQLKGCVDLLVCDEGHRLKASEATSTVRALLDLQCARRVICTGTPVQNNLKEFYSMMSFVNPGLLGTPAAFQHVFAQPIEAARECGASAQVVAHGRARSEELQRRIAPFQLRRLAEVNAAYLPPRHVFTVLCRPTAAQLEAYRDVLQRSRVPCAVRGEVMLDSAQILSVICRLRQVCNHPDLQPGEQQAQAALEPAGQLGLQHRPPLDLRASSKLACLEAMLHQTRLLGERAVVVSTSTKVLDLVAAGAMRAGHTVGRIDGSTPPQNRQEQVDEFNSADGTLTVFLLSTRAGGAGLNLVGGSRLFLVDSDWNPAMDKQAMARIWRDGQKRPCFIYRLLVTGLIDEKMLQRQLYKDSVLAFVQEGPVTPSDGGRAARRKTGASFSTEELKRLFDVNSRTECDTRDMLAATDPDAAGAWTDVREKEADEVLLAAVRTGRVSFVKRDSSAGDDAGDGAADALALCGGSDSGGVGGEECEWDDLEAAVEGAEGGAEDGRASDAGEEACLLDAGDSDDAVDDAAAGAGSCRRKAHRNKETCGRSARGERGLQGAHRSADGTPPAARGGRRLELLSDDDFSPAQVAGAADKVGALEPLADGDFVDSDGVDVVLGEIS